MTTGVFRSLIKIRLAESGSIRMDTYAITFDIKNEPGTGLRTCRRLLFPGEICTGNHGTQIAESE